jgi:hypothetical protein
MLMLTACDIPPLADAGPDQTVTAGDTVTLQGSGSNDPDPNDPTPGALTFSWTQTAGTTVTLTGADTASPTFTAPNIDETLTFQLSVTDDEGNTATDTVNVTVQAVGNQAPTADAGGDQTVQAGDGVTLDGSASSDPEGDTLTFSWVQTDGTDVTLSGADTDSPTFTAPTSAGSLTFELTVDDGNGGSGSDSVVVIVTSGPPVLFIANFTGNNVTSYLNPDTVNGNIAPDTNLQGAQTQLNNPSDIVVTANETLIASNFTTPSVTSYVDARNTNGNLSPDGNVQGAATLLTQPTTLAINTGDDLLFVADQGLDQILVYSGASTSVFNGNLAPTRTIASAALNNPFGINFGANDVLYVANNAGNNILVFANASNLNGTVTPDRVITSTSFVNLFDVFIDQNDTMYVVGANGFIFTFNDAATLNGAVSPDFTLTVNPAINLTAIAVDSNDIGYIVDNVANAVYSYDGISTLNGTLNPDRTIQGVTTQLNGPIRVFLVE